jgi:hypothetical protein
MMKKKCIKKKNLKYRFVVIFRKYSDEYKKYIFLSLFIIIIIHNIYSVILASSN